MKYRDIEGLTQPVSEVGFGVWSVATPWWGVKDDKVATNLLNSAYEDYGITFFDTADVYGQGKGETILSDALSYARHNITIATKFGYDIYAKRGDRHGGHSELPQQWDAASIRRACEDSLRRLQTDYIDMYQLHNPRMEAIESEEVHDTLAQLKKEGKILLYGVALGPDIGWREEGLTALRDNRMGCAQIINNMIEQDPARDLIAQAEESKQALIVRVPHASGLLDGSYDPDKHFDKTDHRSHRPVEWMQAGVKALGEWKFLYDGTDRTIGQAAILFSLYNPTIKSVLPNITTPENLAEFAAAPTKSPLSAEEMTKITALWEGGQRKALAQPFSDSISKPTPVPMVSA